MTDRKKIIDEVRNHVRYRIPEKWNGESFRTTQGMAEYLTSAAVGPSFAHLLPGLERLKAEAETNPTESLRIAAGDKGALQVRDAEGIWYGVSWNRDRKDDMVDLYVSLPEDDDLDYPYADRIAWVNLQPERSRFGPYYSATVSLKNFGRCLDAIRAFADATGYEPVSEIPKQDFPLSMIQYKGLLELDGGIAGDAFREVGRELWQISAKLAMEWAAGVMPAMIDAYRDRGIVRGSKVLVFNDLDNYTTLAEADGRSAIFHRNTSLISDYRGWVLVKVKEGGLSLHALKDDTDDYERALAALDEGRELPNLVITLDGKDIRTVREFDDRDSIENMAFYLNCTKEILVDGKRGDEDLSDDFFSLDSRFVDDDFHDDSEAPQP